MTYKYIVELDGKINGYFEELEDAVMRHSQLDGAHVYKVVTWRTTITEVDDMGNDLVAKG